MTFSLSSAPSVENIKKIVYISFGLTAFAWIFLTVIVLLNDREFFTFGAISFLIAKLLAFGLMIKALLDIKKLCGEPLLALFLTYTLLFGIGAFLTSFAANLFRSNLDNVDGILAVAFVFLLISYIFMFHYYNALDKISGEKSFLVVFWLNILGFVIGVIIAIMMGKINVNYYSAYKEVQRYLFTATTIGIILSLITFVVELNAWSQVKKFKKIENSNSNGDDEASNRDN